MNKRVILATGIVVGIVFMGSYMYFTAKQVESECQAIYIASKHRYGANYGGFDFQTYSRLVKTHGKCIETGEEHKEYQGCILSLGEKLK